jgi:hypothetical protein
MVKGRAGDGRGARRSGGRDARPRWTKSEVALLKRLYKTQSNASIADLLGRKVSSVVFKAHRLGLAKGMKRLKEMGRENISRRWKRRRKRGSRPTGGRRA